ncbi:MAG TPA: apolipoprotein N-acyltransferase [Thermoanaerobaculia bacterium]|nr:apolipoprotein N-acyltransferase [Thermoanaerobaculia bacterium]
MRRLLWPLFAAVSGVAWALCFGRHSLPVASFLALAPLVVLLRAPRPGWLGWLHGFVYWMTALSWIPPTLVTYGRMPLPAAIPLVGLLAAYLALFHAAFAGLGARILRRGGFLPWIGLPALWVALEWLRTYLGGGFPWNLAAYAWTDVPGALPLSAAIGAYGISFLVVFAATGVALGVIGARRWRWEPFAVGFGLPLLLLALGGRWGTRFEVGRFERLVERPGAPIRLLQPNIANLTAWDPQAVVRNYGKVMDLSRDACQEGALVVWPESAAWPFSLERDPALKRDLQGLVQSGCSVLFNSDHEEKNVLYNSAYLLSAGGTTARYDKRHLVPFGEYVPFRGVFSFVDKLAREAGEYRPGESARLLPWGEERLGMAICYEVVFPEEVAELARAGATVLVTITNDAWYGDTAAPWQHFRAARFRAAENRRPMLRAAITGISALIAPDGSVRTSIGPFEQGVIRGRVRGEAELTPFARCPWLVPAVCSVIALAALGVAWLGRRRPT